MELLYDNLPEPMDLDLDPVNRRLYWTEKAAWSHKTFENGTWGGEIRSEFTPQAGEIVAQEHWYSSGFANTDLDLQLKKHGVHQLIVTGLIAHSCVDFSF